MADGLSLKMWALQSKFAEWSVAPEASLGSCCWPLSVRPGQGRPSPAVPGSTEELLVFSWAVSLLGVKGQHVSLYVCC